MSESLQDPRVRPMDTASDGSMEVSTADGMWAAYPEEGSWWADSYSTFVNNDRLGPFESVDQAVQAILDRY